MGIEKSFDRSLIRPVLVILLIIGLVVVCFSDDSPEVEQSRSGLIMRRILPEHAKDFKYLLDVLDESCEYDKINAFMEIYEFTDNTCKIRIVTTEDRYVDDCVQMANNMFQAAFDWLHRENEISKNDQVISVSAWKQSEDKTNPGAIFLMNITYEYKVSRYLEHRN